jgi:hypothetical protein
MDGAMKAWFRAYRSWAKRNYDTLGRGSVNQCDPKEAFIFLIDQWFNSLLDQAGLAN